MFSSVYTDSEGFKKLLTAALLLRWSGVEVSEIDGCLIRGLWVGVFRADRDGHGLPISIFNFGASINQVKTVLNYMSELNGDLGGN